MAKYQGLKTAGKDIELKYLGSLCLGRDGLTLKGISEHCRHRDGYCDKTFDGSEQSTMSILNEDTVKNDYMKKTEKSSLLKVRKLSLSKQEKQDWDWC